MKIIKKLPLAMAVIAALCPLSSVMAQDLRRNKSTPLWRKPWIKRWPTVRLKWMPPLREGGSGNQPANRRSHAGYGYSIRPEVSGYARYGAQFQTGDQKFVGVDGPTTARRPSAVSATKVTAGDSR
ncbi:Uncharacterised protein [Raoultella terrigena]|uniref:Uncharacterized protein n=1 Tax=Raoultella terrigena TaxID=577 RepID=A0A4U9D0N0_RAOTE|nr:Uncharacterised protein [Raoultella terrigena]